MACSDASGISVKGFRLETKNQPALRFMNCMNVNIEELDVANDQNPYIDISGNKSGNIKIRSVRRQDSESAVIGDEVDKSTIEIM